MASEKRLIDVDELVRKVNKLDVFYFTGETDIAVHDCQMVELGAVLTEIDESPTVDAVEVEDKELLKAIKILVEQYGHSKRSDYVHSPVAHALYHTWKKVDEAGRRKEKDNG